MRLGAVVHGSLIRPIEQPTFARCGNLTRDATEETVVRIGMVPDFLKLNPNCYNAVIKTF